MKWFSLIVFILLTVVHSTLAQESCPAFVNAVLESVQDNCAEVGRNQACYGNVQIHTTPRGNVSEFTFEQSGDLADISSVQTFQLSSLSLTDETWGIAVMKLQANLPDTLPGQNVTMLLFGNVELEHAGNGGTQLLMTASGNINVRLRPTTNENNVITALQTDQEVTATGRLEDNSWVYISLDVEPFGGWVSASLLNTDGDIETLPIVTAEAPSEPGVQGYYFTTGFGDRPCTDAPDSGILVQTPEGAANVQLTMNGVEILLNSTAYLQAANGVMTIALIEGSAVVTANGVSQIVPAGSMIEIPLTPDGQTPVDAPGEPQPYSADDLSALPISLLERDIVVATPLEADEIEAAIAELEATVPTIPVSGTYLVDTEILEGCEGDALWRVGDPGDGLSFTVEVSEDGQTVTLIKQDTGFVYSAERVTEGHYSGTTTGTGEIVITVVITVTFPTPESFNMITTGSATVSPCSPSTEFVGELVEAAS